ncbi:MAG: MFS transporter [Chloroflexi bacterium GWB2_49_20]|nr:MAG: MFS transporter [Chloroflexi bacterium GWB2_49_20]OGN77045.1 MAG: MFS transporter [Chloroflexi bacterium GWC2_49_37]OGN83770.1 MAG: MFS transporter [Chloroflexi bacterium GWD2_49_16]HCM96846.1 MFS transporter [Anaerolineae bacterium]
MPETKSPLRSLPRNVWIVTATSFLTDISSEMLSNLVPLFLANVLGASTAIVGLIEGLAETTASLMKIYSGALSDRLGKRKWLTVLGYALSTVAKPFLYFANSWGWVLGVRFSDRLGKGIRTAPRDALVADGVQEKQRGLAFGLHRAGDTFGAFLGIGIAALIVWLNQSQALDLTRRTFQIAVLASIIPAVLAVIVLAVGAREASVPNKSAVPVFSLKGMDKRFKLFLLVVILFTLGNSSDAFIILRAQERGLNVLHVLLMMMTFTLVYSLLSAPLGILSDRIGRRKLIIAGWLTYGLVYLGFAASTSGWQIWALFGLYGVYYAATEGIAKALVADLVPPERRGTAYGIYNAAIGLTVFPASLIAGLLWQGAGSWHGLGPSAPFIFGAVLALLAGLLFWRLVPAPDSR